MRNVATMPSAGTSTLTADPAGNANYNAAPQATANVTINKASQLISGFSPATPIAYTSGGTFTLTATGGASGNAVVFATTTSTVCSVTGNMALILSAGTCRLKADQAGTANYNAANQVTASVIINKTAQTITGFSPASPVNLAVGGTFTLSATGGASGNPVSFTSSTAAVCTTGGVNNATVTAASAGTCTLTANQAGDATYTAATPVSATVFITALAAEAQIYYIHADHLGSPRAITKPSDNSLVWKWENSDPFGANAPNEDPTGTGNAFQYNLRFGGRSYYDSESGTMYMYFRTYDPSIGRFPESDPIGLKGGINTYAYVGGNPLSKIDPFGLRTAGQQDAASPTCCKALQKFISYEKTSGSFKTAMGRYGAARFTDDMMGLNCPFESTGGPVDIDWMMRSLGYGLGGDPVTSTTIFYAGKLLWNAMNAAMGNGGLLDELGDPSYTNAPLAASRWVMGGVPLEQMFAPALKKCKKCDAPSENSFWAWRLSSA